MGNGNSNAACCTNKVTTVEYEVKEKSYSKNKKMKFSSAHSNKYNNLQLEDGSYNSPAKMEQTSSGKFFTKGMKEHRQKESRTGAVMA